MKKKFQFQKSKKKLALLLAMALTVTGIGDLGFRGSRETVHAGETETVVFAQGYGTGSDFSTTSWKFAGQAVNYNGGANYDISTNTNGPKITTNPYPTTGTTENVIRLIDGVRHGDTNGNESSSSFWDYRSGEAFLNKGIEFNSNSEFSMKFTFSMPDAVVNTNMTGGIEYAREVGGDGIAFVMTTNETHTTQAGSGIGYQGIDNSVAIEMDSFFNGAYCDMNGAAGTAYTNWGFDNQLYFHKKWQYNGSTTYANSSNPYGDDATEDDIDYVPYRNYNYSERFDHIGITLNGNVKKHEAIAYINNLDPTDLTANASDAGTYYTFDNLAYFTGDTMGKANITDDTKFTSLVNSKSSNTESASNDCATRFTDKNVDKRLFTVWVDYDGTTMYVRYANGNFKDAVRPTDAAIAQTIDMSNFDGETVYMGFTSAVGSSKANHTIHSFAFTNDYMSNGITTKYTSKYYRESPEAESDYITVNGKKYVCDESLVNSGIALGSSATIVDRSATETYKAYELADYSTLTDADGNLLYPNSVDSVAADGSTVLYQFYNLKPTYTVEYYLEVDADTEGATLVNGKYFKLNTSVVNSESVDTFISSTYNNTDMEKGYYWASLKGSTIISDTQKKFLNYEPDYATTISAGYYEGYVKSDNSLVLKYYYSKIITKYTEKYYVEDDTATTDYIELTNDGVTKKYKLQTTYTNELTNVEAEAKLQLRIYPVQHLKIINFYLSRLIIRHQAQ